ncbi:hypothetical protein GUJ93_ZPchr0008g11410 [Zizania palustris]|uniref:Uncharacterized protein n=1 Tax=Zizania palustris TaxID=103762 RepID=A0A8J5V2A8_ZIZPA|nr:hypothetical protein GUJ93_ZPchr0008g11410 [Zizania palustris]
MMAAATTVGGTTSCGEAAAHAPNSGGATPCRAAATDSGVASCRGLRWASEGSGVPLPGGAAAGPPGHRHYRWRLGEGSVALLSSGAVAAQGSAAICPGGAATGLGPATLLPGGAVADLVPGPRRYRLLGACFPGCEAGDPSGPPLCGLLGGSPCTRRPGPAPACAQEHRRPKVLGVQEGTERKSLVLLIFPPNFGLAVVFLRWHLNTSLWPSMSLPPHPLIWCRLCNEAKTVPNLRKLLGNTSSTQCSTESPSGAGGRSPQPSKKWRRHYAIGGSNSSQRAPSGPTIHPSYMNQALRIESANAVARGHAEAWRWAESATMMVTEMSKGNEVVVAMTVLLAYCS